ncbi:hypothetical protein M885DRAFT_556896 [Pelagophyceae sp. CCMP2097]|nr:hypothetical protein M885DRAFT_556896 [Pelagophyceae sp. CCMP2097]
MASAAADVEVRRADQALINEFGRLNAKLHERRGDVDAVKKTMEELDDAATELAMGDGGGVKCVAAAPGGDALRTFASLMLGGESFVDVEEDAATEYCEQEQAKLQAELDEHDGVISKIQARQKELKTILYGRFGSNINLEER